MKNASELKQTLAGFGLPEADVNAAVADAIQKGSVKDDIGAAPKTASAMLAALMGDGLPDATARDLVMKAITAKTVTDDLGASEADALIKAGDAALANIQKAQAELASALEPAEAPDVSIPQDASADVLVKGIKEITTIFMSKADEVLTATGAGTAASLRAAESMAAVSGAMIKGLHAMNTEVGNLRAEVDLMRKGMHLPVPPRHTGIVPQPHPGEQTDAKVSNGEKVMRFIAKASTLITDTKTKDTDRTALAKAVHECGANNVDRLAAEYGIDITT